MVADATKLIIYNEGLRILGERRLLTLAEVRPPRFYLDDVWDGGCVQYCLEQGQWLFATRSQKLAYNPAITTGFGYRYGFTKPADFVRTTAVCSDEYFNTPTTKYADEAGYWYSDLNILYIKFVSNDPLYGFNDGLWPETFKKFMAAYMASEICERLTQNETKLADVLKIMNSRLTDARSKDCMAGPTQFPPLGGWARARLGNTTRDRGNRGSLIG